MGNETTDEELMQRYGNGSAEAFEMLYEKHKGPMYRYILRHCNETAVDELYQEVWLKLIKARSQYTVKAKFTTWFYKIAHNRIIDFYRKKNLTLVNSDDIAVENMVDTSNTEPDKKAEFNQQQQYLINAIKNLPIEQRDVFLLKEETGLSIDEIAETTGVNTETAKSRLRYAMNKLRDEMKQYHE